MPGPDDDVAEGTPVLLTATFLLFFYKQTRQRPRSSAPSFYFPGSLSANKTHLASKVSDVQRLQLFPSLVTVTDILECLSGVLSGLLDKDFVSTWVLIIGTKEEYV
jgi:hypothetical protein